MIDPSTMMPKAEACSFAIICMQQLGSDEGQSRVHTAEM